MNRAKLTGNWLTLAALGALAAASTAPADTADSMTIDVTPTLTLNLAQAAAQPPAPTEAEKAAASKTEPPAETTRCCAYGSAGSRWWTVGGSLASNFDDATDVNIFADWSQFITDNLEFAIEAAAWYFDQPGENTGGLSGSFLFRWHFLHADDYKWSIFGDAGIGLLASFDEVPDGGTGFNFLPRIGAGATFDLDSSDGPDHGARLLLGVRYHHISNARIEGDSNNPARDAVCFYASIVFPF